MGKDSNTAANKEKLVNDAMARMPSFSRRVHESLVNARNQRFYQEILNVRPDSIDDRDWIYQPGLVEIRNRLDVPGIFKPEKNDTPPLQSQWRRFRRKLIRKQGSEGSCTGQALATVIDIQNLLRTIGDRSMTLPQLQENNSDAFTRWWERRVSVRMLYEMARSLDQDPEDRIAGSTLRNAIKAFGQNGVCTEKTAPYEEGEVGWHLSIAHAKEARSTGLGAYYRLRPILYDYHAALNEVGAIYVSAMIHDGWHWQHNDTPQFQDSSSDPARAIVYPGIEEARLRGGHAFVIIGYDAGGFLVLNSWGRNWGTWKDIDTNEPKGLAGIAHWSYEDWQDNVLDAWVFRLTVASERVFKKEGGYGKGLDPITGQRYSKTPRFLVNGHYVNLKEGRFVRTGKLPNNERMFKETSEHLLKRLSQPADHAPQRQYFDLMIAINSGFEPISQGIHFAASIVTALKPFHVYPILVYWNYALLAQVENLISASLPDIMERSGSSPATIESRIERYMRDYRSYFWERLKENVANTVAVQPETRCPDLYNALLPFIRMTLQQQTPIRLHFIAHSDGVFILDCLLRNLGQALEQTLTGTDEQTSENIQARIAEICHSITLIAPLSRKCDLKGVESIAKIWSESGLQRRIGLVTLSKVDELRDKTGAYARTYPYLAQQVFFPGHRKNEDELICGLHDNAVQLDKDPYYSHIVCPESGIDAVRTHFGMIRNPDLLNTMFNHMIGKDNDQASIISAEDLFTR